MRYVESVLVDGKTLIHVTFFQYEFSFPPIVLFTSVALFFIGMILASPPARRSVKSLLRQPRRAIFLILSIGCLLFTLKPSSETGWGIVLYLTLGSVGMTMLFVGASPLIDALTFRLSGLEQRIGRWFYGMPIWILLTSLFALVFTAANLASYFLIEHIPHVADSVDQFFHAKIFLLGKLTVPSYEPREFFNFVNMINNGRWYSQYPPGHSLLLSFGHIFHAPWIINPLFGSLSVVLLYFVGKEIYNDRIGRLAALLGALSPFLIFMSSEFMNHISTLFFFELFLLGFVRMVKKLRVRDALLAGFSLGYIINMRPMTAIAIGFPFLVYAIVRLVKLAMTSRRESLRFGVVCFTALAMFGVMLGALLTFNCLTNGSPLTFGYHVMYGPDHNPGFGISGWGNKHTPQRGLIYTFNNLNMLNKYLFEIPIPSLIFAFLAFASLKANVWDLLLMGYAASLLLAYFAYWYQDLGFGPRFMFASIAGLILLSARGIASLPRTARDLLGADDENRVRSYIALVLIACFCLGIASNMPALTKFYSNNFWMANGKMLKAVGKIKIENAIVFVRSTKPTGYRTVFPQNHPLLKSDVIYARYLEDEKNAVLMRKFPGRKYYIANGTSIVEYTLSEAASGATRFPPNRSEVSPKPAKQPK